MVKAVHIPAHLPVGREYSETEVVIVCSCGDRTTAVTDKGAERRYQRGHRMQVLTASKGR